ncbi:hypothetical protein PR048_013924 [Dryococelus australis]|uniref:Uncharacterized protein n=1 Tax=Dryococelus australis TaxID=614101 RepID=A0ABQ9HUG6_9NEOP|nr:hypothetical protein PR048_013924 [Dryococelus australis]
MHLFRGYEQRQAPNVLMTIAFLYPKLLLRRRNILEGELQQGFGKVGSHGELTREAISVVEEAEALRCFGSDLKQGNFYSKANYLSALLLTRQSSRNKLKRWMEKLIMRPKLVSEEIWAALNSEFLRADEVSMDQRRNEGNGQTGDPRESSLTRGIVRHDSHMQKSRGWPGRGLKPVRHVQYRVRYKNMVEGHKWIDTRIEIQLTEAERNRRSERMKRYWEERSGAGMKGRVKGEIPEKTRRPTASTGTIPTCENPVTRTVIEPGSPWWDASVLTAQPPRPRKE